MKTVKIGNLIVGEKHHIIIQTMLKKKTSAYLSIIKEIKMLEKIGCEMVRVAINDELDALAIKKIKAAINIPLIADIQYSASLALLSIENGIDKIRINPGNFPFDSLKEIIIAAKTRNVAIRIGLNTGSIKELENVIDHDIKENTILRLLNDYIVIFKSLNYENILISIKDTDPLFTIKINKKIASLYDYPLHIGFTEAGPIDRSAISSSIVISNLLLAGIGATIRVSISSSPRDEILVAKQILSNLNLYNNYPKLISCPTCGRTTSNLNYFAKKVDKLLNKYFSNKNISVAIMGCPVNGLGESKGADIAALLNKDKAIIYLKGEIYSTIDISFLIPTLSEIIKKFY